MSEKFYKLKAYLEKEYKWLLTNYPLSRGMESFLHVFYEGEEPDEENIVEINGFASYNFIQKQIETDILLMLDMQKRFDDHDLQVMKKYGINVDYDLYFWMLYHEYGHLLDMCKIRRKSGLRILKKQMSDYAKHTERIHRKMDQGVISQEEGDFLYRELAHEKKADRFANAIYKKKKSDITNYIENMNKGGES
jgi:hypothetical protein